MLTLPFGDVVKLLNVIEYYYLHFSNIDSIAEHVDELYVMLNRNVSSMMNTVISNQFRLDESKITSTNLI